MPVKKPSNFDKKIIVRTIRTDDFHEIIELSKIAFPQMEPWEAQHLESHLKVFPEGQFCVEYGGRIIGSCSSLIVDFEEYDDDHSFDEITDDGFIRNHDPKGLNLYGIDVAVHPDFRGMKIGQRLYEARKQLCRERNLKSIIIGGRIPNYSKHAHRLSAREYVDEVMKQNLYDPVLTFQMMNGFVLKRVNSDYLSDDQASLKHATLMEWYNVDYLPKAQHHYKRAFPVRISVVQYMMKQIHSFTDFANQCEYFIDASANFRSDFVVFPETFTMQLLSFLGEDIPSLQVKKLTSFTEQYIKTFTDLAIKYNVNIIGGSHFVEENHSIYNIAYLFRRDGTVDRQRQIHIPADDQKWWGIQPGNNIHVFDTDCGKIAMLVSYDILFPELARLAVDKGAQIIFTPFSTEDQQGYLRIRYCSQARAIENQVYTVIAGTAGNLTHVPHMDVQYAQSGIFSPCDFTFPEKGIVGECNPNIETIIVGEVDLETLRRSRNIGTVTPLKDRRMEFYHTESKKLDQVETERV
ncbi:MULTISPECIES: bifunctional GNAT family N-acetyltransferase/carbon-nitrogen hydrolase family protein [Bacillaceae]|uniref:bifunctional GNAT family N-acetyltransferase/carbon-nitrogen hydrolase family protein n=1 Tax=Bacillaceae TaxID=186817 RepID=UPI000E7558FA|nr:bifunctional GNAT family N-acetyltransferase/carbon-nitrogen hydrolase family protein [Bacillus sp. PK3_68]RJS61381.1 carbon-nitrogen hydrolase [Bacillus sp. PK3_68]